MCSYGEINLNKIKFTLFYTTFTIRVLLPFITEKRKFWITFRRKLIIVNKLKEHVKHLWQSFLATNKSSHLRCFVKKVFLKISQNSQENTCLRVSFFNEVAGLRLSTLLKERLWHRYFPVNFAQFLRTSLLQNTSGRLLLENSWR